MSNTDQQSSQTMVFKIAKSSDWQRACAAGRFSGSADDVRDGFVHLSAAHQVKATLARHFAGQDDLLLIAFVAEKLGPALKWEPSRGGDLFPHLYAPLPTVLALWQRPLKLGADGVAELNEEWLAC